jgi:hypothetical protein
VLRAGRIRGDRGQLSHDHFDQLAVGAEAVGQRVQNPGDGGRAVIGGGRGAGGIGSGVLGRRALALQVQHPGREDGGTAEGHPAFGAFGPEGRDDPHRQLDRPVRSDLAQLVSHPPVAEAVNSAAR